VSISHAQRRPLLAGRRFLGSVHDFRIPSYTVMLYIGVVTGTLAGAAVAGAEGLSQTAFVLSALALLVPALLGARALFVLTHISFFRAHPDWLWRRSGGGSALFGGLVATFLLSVPVARLVDVPFWRYWDAVSVAMLLGLTLTRLGCLMNGCCSGRSTDGRLGVWLPDTSGTWERRYPVQVLEAVWGAAILVTGLVTWRSTDHPGALFAVLAAGYGAGRLLLEPLRGDPRTHSAVAANIIASATLIALAAAVLIRGRIV
jgi:phosphatidylglycerol---prolipoprotein diacylglyceryl transferase